MPKPRSGLSTLILIALIISAFFLYLSPAEQKPTEIPLSGFVDAVEVGDITSVTVKDTRLEATMKDGSKVFAIKEIRQSINDVLGDVPQEARAELKIQVEDTQEGDFWLNLLISAVPLVLIIGFFFFMFRQAQSSNNQAMSFGKSRARLYDQQKKRTTFDDVAGAKEAKNELIEIVDFLKNPAKYLSMGAKIPKGVLLVGPPGCGKTLLARAVAGEAKVPFFNISGSEFVEMFVGVGASRVRDLFKKAKRNAPCIIFIDEIDAVGRQRGTGLGGGHDEREQTLNQILTEMDGFETETNIIVMAATNRPDVLDPALLRPGRFDRRVVVDQPDIEDRRQILVVHSKGKPLEPEVDLEKIAKQTSGFVGADLENLLNEAAILTARKSKKKIGMRELEESIEKVLMGPERKSKVMSKQEREITAYHEAGHALAAQLTPGSDPVHKVSIVARGMALGVTWFLPEEDKHLYSKAKYQAKLVSLLGGYVAEELVYGKENITTGASNDLEKASEIARKMVTAYGMSDLGPVIYGEQKQEVFLGRDLGHVRNYSEEISSQIDAQIRYFITTAYKRAQELLSKNTEKHKAIADLLLEKETISREEFLHVLGEGPMKKKQVASKKNNSTKKKSH
ncbi:cell division protein FtsH [Candidatus Peregrinibacteria bacterium CG_4_9_14_0_2_um_filter_53_11]|nr:MAG: cell division protein FtsH [Candidatus Peregrinibacteria bacterium CG_4_9_14_0_2_um_filter_53_11]